MAEVLEAEILGEAGFVRRVAIKRMLASASDDPMFVRMFLDEARIASRLHHANIVAVLDYGVVDGAPFQVLELVDGCDARTLLRRAPEGKLPIDIALYLTAQVGHALAAAHEARDAAGAAMGIVHRDVSPANVLVSWDGDVKIADFGIAFAKDKADKTEAGTTKGTLSYMAPEQAITGRVDARADVFSLGCVLHALAAGASPIAGEGFIRFLERQELDLDPSLPGDVRDIVEMATRYAPERRFQSAVALTEAVGQALAARTTREPRRRLVEHLAPSRQARRPQGRLDAFLQVDILLASSDPSSREFRTADLAAAATATGMIPAPAPLQLEDTVLDPGATQTALPALPPRRGRHSWLAAIAALTVALAIPAGLFVRRVLSAAPPPLATTASIAPAGPSMSEPAPSRVIAAEPPPVATPPSAVPTTPRKTASTAHAPPRESAPTAVVPTCVGTLYFSCPSAPRGRIEIDGHATAYHHGDFADVPCAAHAITFGTEDGRRAERRALPSSAHTRTMPLEIRCGLEK
jgi:tRNA A-37 threonylcarbamoyl transferase component Bud32